MQRVRRLFLFATLCGSACAWAASVPKSDATSSNRLLRRVQAPREVVDLQGEWLFSRAPAKMCGEEPVPMINGKEYKRKLYEYAPIPTNAVWQAVRTPFVELNDSRDHLVVKRRFVAPKVGARRAILTFESIEDAFVLTLNGREYSHLEKPAYGLTTVFDLTDAVREGENEISVDFRFVDFPDCKFLSRRGGSEEIWGKTRGIRGPVQLEFVEPVFISDVFVKTTVEGGTRLEAEVSITNTTDAAVSIVLTGEVDGVKMSERAEIPANAVRIVKVGQAFPTARLWTPDTPALYNLDLRLERGENGSPVDAYRQRFGFRQFSIRGHRFYLNGIPFMARSGWPLTGKGHDQAVEYLRQFKKRGFNAMRIFVGQGASAEVVDAADEVGILSMIGGCTENGGGGWDTRVQNDGRFDSTFWANYDAFNLAFVRDFRNHPGVICWSLGCEFGPIYCGMGSGREKVTAGRICASAEKVMALDPTRTWCENGGVEVGCPIKGRGPCPIRSFHYPVPLNTDQASLPDVAYWYADGVVPWQKVADFKKPTVITEDCYHGMQDSFRTMSRFANDAIYTVEGYRDTLRKGFNLFAEGYYAGELAWWEPWMPRANAVRNRLFDDYEEPSIANGMKGRWKEPAWQCIPEWMVALRPFYATLEGGKSDERTLFLYNQTFTAYEVELVRTDRLDGKDLGRTTELLRMPPGTKVERKVVFTPPEVNCPTKYTITYALRTGGKELTSRTFTFTVFPSEIHLPTFGDMALLRDKASPLAAFDLHFKAGASSELDGLLTNKNRRVRALVVSKSLTVQEGKKVNDFVQTGGRVLILHTKEGDWNPREPLFGKVIRQCWRRNAQALTSFPSAALQSWRGDGMVTQSAFPKDGREDSLVVDDCGLTDGLSASVTTWLFRGKGAYLLSQVPVLEKWMEEIAARHYFAALCSELVSRNAPSLNRSLALWDCASTNEHTTLDRDISNRSFRPWREVITCGPSYEEMFKDCGIFPGTFSNALDEADVVFMDGSQGLTREKMQEIDRVLSRCGTTVIVSELPEDTDSWILCDLGCQMKPTRKWLRDENGEWLPERRPHPMGEFPWWVIPKAGVLTGLTADDFLWYKEGDVSAYMDFALGVVKPRPRPKHDDSLMTAEINLFGDGGGKPLASPCAVAELRRGKGTLILSTLRFRAFYGRYGRQVRTILRTMLTNLGCATSKPEKVYDQVPLNISKYMNRNLWRDPKYQKADGTFEPEAWFGDENDFRYFPVNLCGWSTVANNFCPKGEFPKQPMLLAGKRFLVQDPELNQGKSVIYLGAGESISIDLGCPVKADRFRLLGTAANFGKESVLEVVINGQAQEFNGDEHFGARWWAAARPFGVVAWAGETPKDSNGGLYSWICQNPDPKKKVRKIVFRNRQKNGGFVLLAITAESEMK